MHGSAEDQDIGADADAAWRLGEHSSEMLAGYFERQAPVVLRRGVLEESPGAFDQRMQLTMERIDEIDRALVARAKCEFLRVGGAVLGKGHPRVSE